LDEKWVMNWKRCRRKRSWLNLRHYCSIGVEGLLKPTGSIAQESMSPSWDPWFSEWESDVSVVPRISECNELYACRHILGSGVCQAWRLPARGPEPRHHRGRSQLSKVTCSSSETMNIRQLMGWPFLSRVKTQASSRCNVPTGPLFCRGDLCSLRVTSG
jgi:hypothetical protein